MSDLAKLEAELVAAGKAAAEVWEKWEKAASQDKDAFLKRYNDIQGGVESLRQRISSHGRSPARQPDAELTKLWRELAAMEPESGGILRLPERAKSLHPQLRDRMIVRQPYVQLRELVHAHANSDRRNLLVTGTSGTGKSVWAIYLLASFAQQGKTVLFVAPEGAILFNGDGAFPGPLNGFLNTVMDPKAVVLLDAVRPPAMGSSQKVLVASPNRDVYKRFMKEGARVRIMPLWTLEELQSALPIVAPHTTLAELDERFALWGGSARNCLQLSLSDSRPTWLAAVRRLHLPTALRIIDDPSENPVAAQLIAHVPDANLELQGYEFCSEEIAREAFEFQRSKSVQDLEQILVELAHYPMAASMRGQLFEQYVLRVAVPQGCTVEVIDFETRDARQQAIPAHKIQHFGDNELHKLAEARGDSPVIYVPENRRFRAIDAFAHPGQLMQIHVGAKHAKVSGAALERVLQASGTAFDAEHPPVLQQWVPADMVDNVKPVEVDGTRPQHLQRQLIGINFKPAAHQA